MSGLLTWQEFLTEADELIKLSENTWKLIKKVQDLLDGNTYLVYNQKLKINTKKSSKSNESNEQFDEIDYNDPLVNRNNTEELINIEYHIVYSISYQVPVIYFNGYRNDGSLVSLEDSWNIFTDFSNDDDDHKPNMMSILTQMEHPVLFRPYLALHPCRTAEILSTRPDSKNRIVTFLSVMGPFVKLHLNPKIGINFND